MRFNGFLCVWDQISVTIFARKNISWHVRKPSAKQIRFQIVTIFFPFCFRIFLRYCVTYVPAGFCKVLLALIIGCHGGSRGGGARTPPPEKSQKLGFLSNTGPDLLKNHKASIQCWAIIGPPASDITFWICAWLYFKELYFRKDIISVFSISTPVTLRMQKASSRFLLHIFP